MKAIMMSIRPRHVRNILNGDKIKEIRKKFPSDYVGWIYIYVTKGKELLFKDLYAELDEIDKPLYFIDNKNHDKFSLLLNGKVVARFYCNGVDEYCYGAKVYPDDEGNLSVNIYDNFENNCLLPEACIGYEELKEYSGPDLNFKAIKIGKVEIFDKPKELREFKRVVEYVGLSRILNEITKAPQSWIYIDA